MKQIDLKKGKKSFLLILTLFAFNFSSGYANITSSSDDNEWTFYSEKEGIKFSYKVDFCEGKNVLFLKFENTNTVEKNIDFQLIINGLTTDMAAPQVLHLNANETVSGACNATPVLRKNIENAQPTILNFILHTIK